MPDLPAAGDVFKALADPTRRTILDELAERNEQTLFELCARLAMKHQLASTRQAVSQHLDVLEAAGLIRTRREGRYKFHSLDTSPLERMLDRWLKPPAPSGSSEPPGPTGSGEHGTPEKPHPRTTKQGEPQ